MPDDTQFNKDMAAFSREFREQEAEDRREDEEAAAESPTTDQTDPADFFASAESVNDSAEFREASAAAAAADAPDVRDLGEAGENEMEVLVQILETLIRVEEILDTALSE